VLGSSDAGLTALAEPIEASPSCHPITQILTGEIQWLKTSTTKQLNITRMPPNPIALRPNIMPRATTRRGKNIQPAPSNIPRMLANTANKRTPRVSNRSKQKGPTLVGPSTFSRLHNNREFSAGEE